MEMRQIGKNLAVATALGLGLVAAVAPVASATGSGTTLNGCRAQYFTTAFSTKCTNTTASASYKTTGWCDYQKTQSGTWLWLKKGSSANGVSSGACTFGVYKAQVYGK